MTTSCDNLRPERVGRLAPSPSGRIHLGNLLSFMMAALSCDRLVLRIEDLDPQRSKEEHVTQLLQDLEFFGFEWSGEVVRQSERTHVYEEAFGLLRERGLTYPCFCTRADLHSANAPHFGEEVVYAGTCRDLTAEERVARATSRMPAQRLVVPDRPIVFDDLFQGPQEWNLAQCSGDFVIRRADGVFAYQLAVVVDDAAAGVNQVVRGFDLLSSVPRQRYLQELLGLPCPEVGHVPLLVDEQGRRLAKRNVDTSLAYLIDERHLSAEEILGGLAHRVGIIDEFAPMGLVELRRHADLGKLAGCKQLVVSRG